MTHEGTMSMTIGVSSMLAIISYGKSPLHRTWYTSCLNRAIFSAGNILAIEVWRRKVQLCRRKKLFIHPSDPLKRALNGLIKDTAFKRITCFDIGALQLSRFSRIRLLISSSIVVGYESFLPWPFLKHRLTLCGCLIVSISSFSHLA